MIPKSNIFQLFFLILIPALILSIGPPCQQSVRVLPLEKGTVRVTDIFLFLSQLFRLQNLIRRQRKCSTGDRMTAGHLSPFLFPALMQKKRMMVKQWQCSENWGYMNFVLNLTSFNILSQETWVDASTLTWGYLFSLVKNFYMFLILHLYVTGVVLSCVVKTDPKDPPFLLVLDAKTFTELGRATVNVEMHMDLHGMFIPQQDVKTETE